MIGLPPQTRVRGVGRQQQVDYFNFLGVTLDQNIPWNPHVDKVFIKITRVTGLLRKLQHYFPKHILITIYNSIIHSRLMYSLLVWGFQSMRVEKLQKKKLYVYLQIVHIFLIPHLYLRN